MSSQPRLRNQFGEIEHPSYLKFKERGQFSEEILIKMMSGLSARRYQETAEEEINPKHFYSRHQPEKTPLYQIIQSNLSCVPI